MRTTDLGPAGRSTWRDDTQALEKILLELWKEVLARNDVGLSDNFFEFGGRSLHAVMITSRLEEITGLEVPADLIFRAQTVSEMIGALTGQGVTGGSPTTVPVPRTGR